LRYFEKPPLQYWATAASFEVFGQHNWSARLWVALSGFLGLVLTAWIGTRLYGALTGALAALVQGGALLYLGLARISTLDMGLTATLELALVGLLLLVQRGPSETGTRRGALLLALGVALAFLSKGLVGILIPGTVAVCYLLMRRDWSLIWRARPWWTLLALALIAAPWVVLVEQRNPGFAQFFFVHEQFARFLTRVHQRYQPDWFFVPVLLLGFMPWTPLLPSIARRGWLDAREGDGASLMLAIWVVFSFLFFSLSQSKLIPYILPLFPALSLLAGRTLALAEPRRVQRALGIASALWAGLSLTALWVWRTPAMSVRLDLPAGPVVPTIVASFLIAAVLTAAGAWLARRRGALPGIALASLGTVLLVGALLITADHLPAQRHNRGLVAAAAARLTDNTAFYCVDAYEQSIPFYLHRTCTLVGYRGELDFGLAQQPERWISDLGQFALRWRAARDALAVIRPESYLQLQRMGLPMRVIYTAPNLVAVVRQ
ncbi:MAG TPA: glycosyltransferase family 39 protein, partial [Steroidobacteraceae bacterium]|nr:glycosyltransferase family 39 protein [Steroidobacteraceae bacterium]